MEAQQCVKLSLTNRSFGLIRPSAQRQVPLLPDLHAPGRRRLLSPSSHTTIPGVPPGIPPGFLDDLVVMARGQTPDPIPNSAVKTLSADGTAS